MKSAVDKVSRTTTASVQRKAATPFFTPVRKIDAPFIQAKLKVNAPNDALEREADAMADKVVRMPSPPPAGRLPQNDKDDFARQPTVRGTVQRRETGNGGVPSISSALQSTLQGQMSGGQPLSADVRRGMESRFNADFSNVRVHSDAPAASLSNQLSARAFTYQNHIFFSRDQYQPGSSSGQHLIAHELTHTLQQGHAVQRSPDISVTAAPPTIQRIGVQDALDRFAEWGYAIPGFRMLTLLLGFNPINMRPTDRSAANLLRALIEVLPGGIFITQALDNHGVINRAAAWVEEKLAELGDIGSAITRNLGRFIDSLSWRDISDLSGVWERAKRIFTEPIGRLISFGGRAILEVLKMVKDAILRPLAALAQGTRGYDLLCAMLGEDPISGQPVAASAENLLGGFMKLIGQEEIWENIKRGNATARAWAWFQAALAGLMGFARSIPIRILNTLTSLTFQDVVTVAGAFAKIVGSFANVAIDFISWGMSTIWNLLEIIFDVVKPGLMGYIRRTGAALRSILRNPLPFLGNLIRAAKLGFENFSNRFTEHLKAALIEWLTGSLEGVYIPRALSLVEMGKFALSVLGITWAQIRGKIVRALGPNGERIMAGLETAFDVVRVLVTGGIAAAWELIKTRLSDLKDQVMSGIISMVTQTIITRAIPRLLSMFIPGAGFITAIISIYNTVMVFVEKISRIIQVVTAFIDSIVTIAAGNITSAAARVERILAGLMSLAISFLAGFIGLSGISAKIMAVVQRIRASIDRAIDAAVNWVVGRARAFVGTVKAGVRRLFEWWRKRMAVRVGDEDHTLQFDGEGRSARFVIRSEPERPSGFLERRYTKAPEPKPAKGKFVASTQAQEAIIDEVKAQLPQDGEVESGTTPLTGRERAAADAKMARMDTAISIIATNIKDAFASWRISASKGEIVRNLSLTRGTFSRSDKVRLAEHSKKHFAGFQVQGVDVPQEKIKPDGTFDENVYLDRRHVVSSQDMVDHYKQALEGKTVPEARILISERASLPEARIPVTANTTAAVEAAARQRYQLFFSYVNNLFIGPAATNRSLGRLIDPHHPGLVGTQALEDHVARIKREWSFGTGFTISRLTKTEVISTD